MSGDGELQNMHCSNRLFKKKKRFHWDFGEMENQREWAKYMSNLKQINKWDRCISTQIWLHSDADNSHS